MTANATTFSNAPQITMSPLPPLSPLSPRYLSLLIPHPPKPSSDATTTTTRAAAFYILLLLFVRLLTINRTRRGGKWLLAVMEYGTRELTVDVQIVTFGLCHNAVRIMTLKSPGSDSLMGVRAEAHLQRRLAKSAGVALLRLPSVSTNPMSHSTSDFNAHYRKRTLLNVTPAAYNNPSSSTSHLTPTLQILHGVDPTSAPLGTQGQRHTGHPDSYWLCVSFVLRVSCPRPFPQESRLRARVAPGGAGVAPPHAARKSRAWCTQRRQDPSTIYNLGDIGRKPGAVKAAGSDSPRRPEASAGESPESSSESSSDG
ncbi:hypothetical protein EDC01DRAFT_635228 [Geopyxis carbonaria]|nr:hypothetical protein EDC01DRAFT_635228 [Geopyxis carbonaria]